MLDAFFNPKSIVIIGVSRKEFTFNYTILKNLLEIFYRGKIYILNPNADEILGIKSYASLEALPEVPELAVIVLGRNITSMFKDLGNFGVKHIVIESDISLDQNGHFDPSFSEEETKRELNQIAKNYGITYIGPSTIGLINYINNFTTSIIPVRQYIMKKNRNVKSGVSYIAQSGGLAGGLGWWKPSQDLPIVKVIHLGHAYDIEESNVIDYFVGDENTKVVLLFLRSINEKLINAVKKCAPVKPVLFFYVGKDSHSEESLKEAGGIAVRNYIELFEMAKVFLWCPEPKGPNLGMIGPSSGAIYIIAKEMRKQNLNLAKLTNDSRRYRIYGENRDAALLNRRSIIGKRFFREDCLLLCDGKRYLSISET